MAVQSVCTCRRAGNAVLARTCFSDHARLAHSQGQQRLSDGVIDLVSAGVVEIFSLEPDLGAADGLAHPLGVIQRTGAANKGFEQSIELRLELGIALGLLIFLRQLIECTGEGFRDEATAKITERRSGHQRSRSRRLAVNVGSSVALSSRLKSWSTHDRRQRLCLSFLKLKRCGGASSLLWEAASAR